MLTEIFILVLTASFSIIKPWKTVFVGYTYEFLSHFTCFLGGLITLFFTDSISVGLYTLDYNNIHYLTKQVYGEYLIIFTYTMYMVYHLTQASRTYEHFIKKEYVMAAHHIVTGFICIVLFLNNHMLRVSTFIFIIHGASDVPHYAIKIMKHRGYVNNIYYGLRLFWAVLFIITRTILFGYITFLMVFFNSNVYVRGLDIITMLVVIILIMQFFWSYVILNHIFKKGVK